MTRRKPVKQRPIKERSTLLANQPSFSGRVAKGKTELLVNEVINNPEVLQRLASRPEGIGMMMQVSTHTHRSGPLPDAEELSRYENIYPGLAKEIVDMAKSAQDYRQLQGKKSLSGAIWKDRIGQIFALLCVLIVSAVACFMIYKGESASATTLMGTVLVSLAGVFVYGKWEKTQDDKQEKKKPTQKK